jgi:thiol:disulfide interchange protein
MPALRRTKKFEFFPDSGIYISVRTRSILLLTLLLATGARAAHTQVRLALGADTARPGDTVLVGVELQMDFGWHTYWKNSGSSGQPTAIQWQLPPGITAGEIEWPLPQKLPPPEVPTYGYEETVVLIVPLKLAADLKPGPLELHAKVSWLECSKDQCIPAGQTIDATLNIGTEIKPSSDAALIESWRNKVPRPDTTEFSTSASWEIGPADGSRPLIIERRAVSGAVSGAAVTNADFFPDDSSKFEFQYAVDNLAASRGEIRLRKVVKKIEDWPKTISGVLVMTDANGERTGVLIQAAVRRKIESSSATVSTSGAGLWSALGFAFLGGLILNIMPCVLPVIALKIFSFVKQGGEAPGRARLLGLVYAAGILASFVVLAGFLIALQRAGHIASWGSQMQDRNFLIGMTLLVSLVAMNLFGLFEVTLGGGTMTAADKLSGRGGAAGAFFNGLLTTALAIPCTAPFLTAALAFAFGQPPAVIVLIFCFIALGLAAPYVVLTWNPKLLRFLPKPGPWMQYFKIALGFPMLATVVWLYRLASNHLTKSQALWFGVLLVALGMAAWIWGEFVQRGSRRRGLAAIISLLLLGVAAVYASTRKEILTWQPWSQAAVEKAQAEGHPVLVDFTADWCSTCQFNLHHAIDTPDVRDKLAATGAVTLVADYTKQDENIGRELKRFGREAVPLVVVFPKKSGDEPIVLPPLLDQKTVIGALEKAAK